MNGTIEIGGRKRKISITPGAEEGSYRVELEGQPCAADARLLEPGILSLLLDGKSYRVVLDGRGDDKAVDLGDRRVPYRLNDPRSLRSRKKEEGAGAGARPVIASMPGRIIRLLVQAGEQVEAQQGLIVVEAMKMQNELKAPKAGTVTRLAVEVGATVQAGSILLVIE